MSDDSLQGENCPDEAVLDALRRGALPAEAADAANRHVGGCHRCQARATALDAALAGTITPATQLAATLFRREGGEGAPAFAITQEAEGRYQILSELGRGGQSIVFLARDTHLDRDVALKVPRRDAQGEVPEEALVQFLREARITARLEHPNIVPVHEIGRRSDGTVYCTQRLVRGRADGRVRTLNAALRSARSLADRLGLLSHLVDVCSAVAHAHLNRIVHRDLKPDNVVIGELGETIVLDWGIAKSPAEEEVTASVIGTPGYMSPEQSRGDLRAVDERSDVFSIGAMLYELLTGEPPFKGADVGTILEQTRAGAFAPLLSRQPEAPRALAAVVERCLATEPSARYSNAAEVGAELRSFLEHRPVRAYSYGASELLRLFVERHKAVSAIAAISLVLLGALGVVTFQNYRQARLYLSEALVEKARASEAALRWDEAAAYFAAARVQADTPAARYGAMLARSRADIRVRRLVGHSGSVTALDVSADGSRLVSGGFDGTVRLWDPKTGQALWSAAAGGGPISALAFASDGKSVFVATEDKNIRKVDAEGREAALLHAAGSLVNELVASADGRLLAGALEDGRVLLLPLTGGEARHLVGHAHPVYGLAISSDGATLVSGSWDRSIRIWDLRGNAEPRVLLGHEDSVLTLALSPDGKLLMSGSRDASVRVWDMATFAPKERLAAHTQKVTSVALSADGLRLASVSNDKTLRLWAMRPTPRQLVGESLGVDEVLTAVSYVGRDQLAFGGENGALYLRAVSPADPAEIRKDMYSPPSAEDLSFSGDRLISTMTGPHSFRDLEVRDPRTLDVLAMAPEVELFPDGGDKARAPAHSVSFSRSGKFAVGTCGGLECGDPECARYAMCVASLDTLEIRHRFVIDGYPTGTAMHPNQRDIAVGGKYGRITIVDSQTGEVRRTFDDAKTGVFGLDFSADGKLLAAGSYDRTLRLYDTTSWNMRVLGTHEHGIRTVRFRPDGEVIATGGYDRMVRLWDTKTGALIATLKGHRELIRSVAFSPDGTLLASAAWDGTVRLWDVATHVELARYVANDTRVYSVVFAPDGNALFYGGVRPYRVDFPQLLSPEDGLAQALAQTGFELSGSTLVRR